MPTIRGLGPVKPVAKAAAQEIAQKFNVWNIGGFATSGHITNSDHYKGLAIDVMVYGDRAKGDLVKSYVDANWQRLGVKYVIWYRIYYPHPNGQGKEPYTGVSPHTDHVHISFNANGGDPNAPIQGMGSSGDSSDPVAGCLKSFLGMGIVVGTLVALVKGVSWRKHHRTS